MESVEIHPPDSFHPSLSKDNFDIGKVMGTWHVVYSTLPLWKVNMNSCGLNTSMGPILIPTSAEQERCDDNIYPVSS